MDNAEREIKQQHGRVFAARKDLTEYLAKRMPDADVEEAMKMVNALCAMAHGDGAEFGATRAWTAAQLHRAYDENDVNAQLDNGD